MEPACTVLHVQNCLAYLLLANKQILFYEKWNELNPYFICAVMEFLLSNAQTEIQILNGL